MQRIRVAAFGVHVAGWTDGLTLTAFHFAEKKYKYQNRKEQGKATTATVVTKLKHNGV